MPTPTLTPTKKISLRESYDSVNAGINVNTRVDFERGIVFDVELLGPESKNHRRYTSEFIREAYNAVERSGSYIDHPDGENNSRSIKERFGKFVGPYINKSGRLCAREYHYDKSNAFAPSFEWQLRNCPEVIGFSINADAGGYEENGEVIVTRLFECFGFDLVDRPATTNGIFAVRESLQRKQKSLTIREATVTMFPEAFNVGMKELADGIGSGAIDLPTAKKKMGDLLKLIDPGMTDTATMPTVDTAVDAIESSMDLEPDGEEKEMKVMEACSKSKKKAVRFLAAKLDAYRVREQAEKLAKEKEKIAVARVERAKAKFGATADTLLTGVFREQLASAKDDAEADKLIDDRMAVFNVREKTASGTKFEEPVSAPEGQNDEIKKLVTKLFS